MVKMICFYGIALRVMITLLGVTTLGFGVVKANTTSGKKILEVRRKINRLRSHAVRSIQA